jgi:hypothetical protein
MKLYLAVFFAVVSHFALGFSPLTTSLMVMRKSVATTSSSTTVNQGTESSTPSSSLTTIDTARRNFLATASAVVVGAGQAASSYPEVASAATKPTGSSDGNLPYLPSDAVRSYLQYRIPLQIAADYYIFSLQDMVGDIEQWGDVGQLFRVNNNKGQGQPSKIERDYTNPMRVLLLSFPPDVSDEMRDAQFKFEKAMNSISKATAGYRKDLPVEIDSKSIVQAKQGWEDGRLALNEFFGLLNTAVGLSEMKPIPSSGPNQYKEYGRSARRFNELQKKTKLCQNRGGPALSQAWGKFSYFPCIAFLLSLLIFNFYETFPLLNLRSIDGFGIFARYVIRIKSYLCCEISFLMSYIFPSMVLFHPRSSSRFLWYS